MLNQDDKAFITGTITQAIQPLNSRMGSLESKIDSVEQKLSQHDKQFAGLNQRLESLEKEMEGINLFTQMIWQEVCKNTVTLEDLKGLEDVVEANIEAIDKNTWALRDEMDFFISVRKDQGYLQKRVGKLEDAVFGPKD